MVASQAGAFPAVQVVWKTTVHWWEVMVFLSLEAETVAKSREMAEEGSCLLAAARAEAMQEEAWTSPAEVIRSALLPKAVRMASWDCGFGRGKLVEAWMELPARAGEAAEAGTVSVAEEETETLSAAAAAAPAAHPRGPRPCSPQIP
ncbi:hypothetical protein GUJ93_ZPchr0001g29378 [Zizania palustris]|uniref:Uncharacterized protein n=1 Tax=Zizania palustris TaxID=103762 RepID=A0A8J5RLK8_ZIZPA|nr:hypothetical protein GUJ93_ZPchr0001g29378 [Zizania palustris]